MKHYHQILLGCALILVSLISCKAETTDEAHANTDEALRDADIVLNEAYKEVMAECDETQREALRQAQRVWIRYRDACVTVEGSLYEGGSFQPVVKLQCALDLTIEQTARLHALMPGVVAAGQSVLADVAQLQQAQKQAEASMEKVYRAYIRDHYVPEAVEAQVVWEAFRDLWVNAETSCYPTEATTAVTAQCLAALNLARAERLKNLFMEGYREEGEETKESTDLAYADPPIMKAAAANDLDTMKQLIARGANVNEINDADYTALHVAAENGNTDIITALLAAGARTDLYDFDGRTAADIARAVSKPDIARIIDEHGSKPVEQAPPQTAQQQTQTTAENKKTAPEIQNLESLLQYFGNLTDLRQEQWNGDYEWKLIVTGAGEVSEVSRAGFFSEISDAEYEVTCELPNGDRAVLFLGENNSDFVHNLEIGNTITFTGKLKNIADWGLWRTSYIKVE